MHARNRRKFARHLGHRDMKRTVQISKSLLVGIRSDVLPLIDGDHKSLAVWASRTEKTCLWLKGLPKLVETENVYEYMMMLPVNQRTRVWQLGSGHSKERSKTFPGIASAMAEQWG